MNAIEIKQVLKSFLAKFLGEANVEDSDELFSSGLVNSLFSMQLVLFIEKHFNIAIKNEDLNMSNFNSINAMSSFIAEKKSQ